MIGAAIAAGANIVSGIMGANSAEKAAKKQYQQQKEFAQNGIQWKAADAKAAGIHPLYAMGANTTSYSPVTVGDTNPLSGLASAGQDISRAVDATRSPGGKLDAFGKTMQQLQLQRAGLENELLGSQIAKLRQTQSPGVPSSLERFTIPGQPDSGLVKTSPMARQSTVGGGSQEAGPVADVGYLQTTDGGFAPVPTKDAKDRIEDNFPAELAWALRNQLLPSLSSGFYSPPPYVKPADGEYWTFDGIRNRYKLAKRSKSRMWTGGFGNTKVDR